jgi:hypothetical protein
MCVPVVTVYRRMLFCLFHFPNSIVCFCVSSNYCNSNLATIPQVTRYKRSRVSSGSVVSDYGLDDRAIGVRSPAGAKDFSSILCVQTGSGAHPASCTVGTGGPLPGGKARPGRDADHSPLSNAEVVNE